MLDLGFTCLCVYGDQCVIEAEQPTFMQGVLEVIGLLPDPQYRHLGICIRFGAFPGVLGGRWERLGGFRRLSYRTHGAPGKLLGRSRTFGSAPGGTQDAQGNRGRLKHYASNGLEASFQAYNTQGSCERPPEPSPQNIQISTRLLF